MKCKDVSIYLEAFDRLKKVEDLRVLLHSPYNTYQISVNSLRWNNGEVECGMDSMDILCVVSSSGRVHEVYKVVGPRDADSSDEAELDKSDRMISARIRNAFGECVRRTRRFWIFKP